MISIYEVVVEDIRTYRNDKVVISRYLDSRHTTLALAIARAAQIKVDLSRSVSILCTDDGSSRVLASRTNRTRH